MRFIYGKRDWPDRKRGQENCYLLTNGLGGFSSGSVINSNTRNDHALLMAALTAPNVRYNMVNRLEEELELAAVPKSEIWFGMKAAIEPESVPESKTVYGKKIRLSSQEFEDPSRNEEGYLLLDSFVFEDYPEWTFQADGVEVVKRLAMRQGENLAAVEYRIDNRTGRKVCLAVTPHLQFVPKGKELEGEPNFEIRNRGDGLYEIMSGGLSLFFRTNGDVETTDARFCEGMFYAYDACDGRNALGRTCVNHSIRKQVPAHSQGMLELIYLVDVKESGHAGNNLSIGAKIPWPGNGKESQINMLEERLPKSAEEVFREAVLYRKQLRETARNQNPALWDETALQLVMSADQFISKRASTGGKTILAGYPFFEDWGRDTMIALEGCCMVTGRMDTAKSILRTFAKYCRKGLMPNLFPEGGRTPMYNTADAALLFINCVYCYDKRRPDKEFVREMWPVMTEIMLAYQNGTDYGIRMDEDGLIMAGRKLDQVTWMDVRIGDFLPTPRHGKPVEINAYWYNALRAMEQMEREIRGKINEETKGTEAGAGGIFGFDYGSLAEKVRGSFRQKFWMEEKGYLRDVVSCGEEGCLREEVSGVRENSGTENGRSSRNADEQFRCNQIWAVSMPFTMLDREQEIRIVDAVYEKLYTPLGLRTLDREDPDFHGVYGGPVRERDCAYHQGTVWMFPLGAYYLAYLKTRDYSAQAAGRVRRQLRAIESALREGCIGQLPEIYDGENPAFSRGCFAQAWSVGEILRVYEELDKYEQ